jgi:hypothetical protein
VKLVWSEKVWIFSKEHMITDDKQFTKEGLADFFNNYGATTYYYKVTDADRLTEGCLGITKFIFDKFRTLTPIYEGQERVTSFVFRQEPEILCMFKAQYEAEDDRHLREMIEEAVLTGIRFCIREGLLETDADFNGLPAPPNAALPL